MCSATQCSKYLAVSLKLASSRRSFISLRVRDYRILISPAVSYVLVVLCLPQEGTVPSRCDRNLSFIHSFIHCLVGRFVFVLQGRPDPCFEPLCLFAVRLTLMCNCGIRYFYCFCPECNLKCTNERTLL